MSFNMGGRRGTYFFVATKVRDSDGNVTGYKIGDNELSTVTVTDKSLQLMEHISTKIDYDDTGNIKLDFKHYQTTPGFRTFLKQVARPKTSGSKKKDYVYIDGTTHKGAASSDTCVLIVTYLLYDNDDAATKIQTVVALGSIAPTSGSMEVSGEAESSPTFVFESFASDVDITIPAGMFDAEIVTAPSDAKIAKGESYWEDDVAVKVAP